MKKAINKIAIITVLFFGITSCENNGYEDYEQKKSPSGDLNGEWYINIIEESSGSVEVEHALHYTYDSNDGKLWIDDKKHGWYLKGKSNFDVNNLTFSVSAEDNLNDLGSKFTITEGKILKNAAKSKTGVVTDSIYFKAEFDYDPGVIYIHSGHRRTGFEEDEY